MRIISFPGQHTKEKIVLFLHRHWYIIASQIIILVIAALLPIVLLLFLPQGIKVLIFQEPFLGLTGLFLSAYYLSLWLYFFLVWVDYYLDVWIVTDERIINIEQEGLFNRVISEQQIVRVQDVTSEVRGLLPTFLDFGNVYVQTAGEKERFVFEQVPHPHNVKKIILDLYQKAIQKITPEKFAAPHGYPPSYPPKEI